MATLSLSASMDGKPSNFTEDDISRRNSIANLLAEWGLVELVNPEKTKEPVSPLSQIKVLPHKEKDEWNLAAKYNISVLNTPGTIDSDYRGEIKIIIYNHGNKKFEIKDGDRVAQMILTPILKFDFEEVKELSPTIRGSGGFGSTGR